MTYKEVVDHALKTLSERICARTDDVRVIRIDISYATAIGSTGLETFLPVALLPSYQLAQPGAVQEDALSAMLTQTIDAWIDNNAPDAGGFRFEFQWWDADNRLSGVLIYP